MSYENIPKNIDETKVLVELATSAYDATKVEESTPVTQIKASYGLLNQALTVTDIASSGTNTVVDNKFTCQTGVAADGLASLLTLRHLISRPGQGISAYFDAIFTTGVADSNQAAGLIESENSYIFGYIGEFFGILHSHGGVSEAQELTITTPAAGAETATININGNPFSVPLTAGTVQHNAFEIANSLESQVTDYNFTSNDDQVVAQALKPTPQGAFSFSSTGAAIAAWVQLVTGTTPLAEFIPQTAWSVDTRLVGTSPDSILDPTKGNVYQIQIGSNFGAVKFYIEDSNSGDLKLVHIIKSANIKNIPNSTNSAFRLGWVAQNTGNTSNITVQGNAAGGFLEGKVIHSTAPLAIAHEQLSVGLVSTNIIAFRNRIHFGGKVNRSDTLPLVITVSSQTNKSAFFELLANPTFVGDLDFSYLDKDTSTTEIATDAVLVTGGVLVGAITVVAGSSETINLSSSNTQEYVALPGTTYAIVSRVSSGAASDMQATGTWAEDL